MLSVHLRTNTNWFDFEVKRSKIKVMTRADVVQKGIGYASTAHHRVLCTLITSFCCKLIRSYMALYSKAMLPRLWDLRRNVWLLVTGLCCVNDVCLLIAAVVCAVAISLLHGISAERLLMQHWHAHVLIDLYNGTLLLVHKNIHYSIVEPWYHMFPCRYNAEAHILSRQSLETC